MKRIFITFMLALLPLWLPAQSLPVRGGGETHPFRGGERFKYKLHYQWGNINSDVAYATISVDSTVYAGQKAFSARIFGQSSKFYDTFFKVREDFRSTFTPALVPLHFYRDTREGNWACKNDVKYNWAAGTVESRVENSAQEPFTKTLPIQPGTCDITSLVYMMRDVDVDRLTVGQRYIGTMMLDNETFTMAMTYKGIETFKDKALGVVEVLRFAVRLNAGETFDTKEDLIFLFTNDANRIPVRFEAPFKFGAVSGRLISCEGLKYPVEYGRKK